MHYNITYYLNSGSLFDTEIELPIKVADLATELRFSVSCTMRNFEMAKKAIRRAHQFGATNFEIKPLSDTGAIICSFMFDKRKYTGVMSTQGKSDLIKPFKELFSELFPKK